MGFFDSIASLFKKKAPETASADQLREEALALLDRGDSESLDRAIELMERVTKQDPEHIGTYLSLSAAYVMRGEQRLQADPVDRMRLTMDVTGGMLALEVYVAANGRDEQTDLLLARLKAYAGDAGMGGAAAPKSGQAPPPWTSTPASEALAKKIRYASSTSEYVEHAADAVRRLNAGDAAYLVCLKATLWEDDPYRRMDGLATLKGLRPTDDAVLRNAGMIVLEWYKQEPMQEFVPKLEELMRQLGMSPQ